VKIKKSNFKNNKLENDQNIICPFCLEKDFDLIGLKYHLKNGFCSQFEKIINIKK